MLNAIPSGYQMRLYPDLSHTLTAMYPIPDWHYVWAFTAGREAVNPQPEHHAAIIRTVLSFHTFPRYSVITLAYR